MAGGTDRLDPRRGRLAARPALALSVDAAVPLTPEILGPLDTVQFVGRPHPLRYELAEHHLPAGMSIAEMIEVAVPDPMARRFVNVYIGGELVPPYWHARMRPKAGTRLEFRAWVQKDVLGSLLSIAVLVFAMWAGPAALPLLNMTAASAGAGIVTSLVTAGIGIAGSLIVNALVPPPTQGRDALGSRARQESLPGIRGSQNRADPYGPIPMLVGRHMIVPLLGAEHYTERQGDDQYLRSLFVLGYGPMKIRDIKIGDTSINDYEEVEYEVREGYPDDPPIKLYPAQVFQEDLAIELWHKDGWHSRTTAIDIDEAMVDTVAPNGVGLLRTSTGEWDTFRIRFQVMWRRVGASAWKDGGEIEYKQRKPRTRRRSKRIKFPSPGQYEVRIKRLTGDVADSPVNQDIWSVFNDTVVWTALKSIRNVHPVQAPIPLAMIAVRIKATDQLSGVIDDLNCIATSVVKDWNGSGWVTAESRNPASLYRHLLQGPHLSRPIATSRLDLPALQAWHDACRIAGRKCDAVIQGQRTLFDALRDVAATGRAAFLMRDGLYSVRRDVEQTVPVQMITPRNVMSLNAERVFPEVPDALRVNFVSAAAGYQSDELIVYDDGFNAGNAQTFEQLDLWGITDAENAFREARYHMAVAQLRPERLTIRMDMEHLVARPGDMVRVAHDVMLVGLAQGRIVAREMLAGDCLSITVDEDCPMEAGKEYRVVVRREGTGNPELSRLVVTDAGFQRTLTFRTPVAPGDGVPSVGDLIAFGEGGRVTESWIVNGIDPDENLEATLTLVPHAPAVHTADHKPIPDYKPRITIPSELRRPSPPQIIDIQTGDAALERMPNGNLRPRILVQLLIKDGVGEPPIMRVEAQARRAGDTGWDDDDVTVEGFSRVVVRDVRAGERYDMRFRVVSEFSKSSRWAERLGIQVIGAVGKPSTITGFTVEIIGATAILHWRAPTDVDVRYYLVRHTPLLTGAQWATSVHVVRAPATATSVEVPLLIGTYLIKAVDNEGRTSPVAAAVSSTIARVRNLNFVLDLVAHPAFAGTMGETVFDASLGGLRLVEVPAETIIAESQPGVQIMVQPGAPLVMQQIAAVVKEVAVWTSSGVIDLGAVFTARVSAQLLIGAVVLGDDVFAWGDVYSIEDVYGGVDDGVEVRALISTTDDDPNFSPVWSEYQQLNVGDFTARAFRFGLELSSVMPGATPVVFQARFVVDMDDRVWSKRLTVPAGGTTVAFVPPFYVRPDVGLTIQGGAAGDRPTYTVDEDSMTIQILNSGGSGVQRVVEIFARAYGERE